MSITTSLLYSAEAVAQSLVPSPGKHKHCDNSQLYLGRHDDTDSSNDKIAVMRFLVKRVTQFFHFIVVRGAGTAYGRKTR